MKLKVTCVWEIEVDPTHYDASTPEGIAAEYKQHLEDNPEMIDWLIETPWTTHAEAI